MATISKLTLVEVVAASSGLPTIQKWSTTTYEQPGLGASRKILGVTATDCTDGQDIAAIMKGYLRSCPMQGGETWVVGDVLWATTAGAATKTRPTAPFPLVCLGVVFAVSGSNADVAVNVNVIPSVAELSNVLVDAPADKDILIYNATNHYYETRQIDHGGDIEATSLLDDDHPQYLQRLQYRHAHTHNLEDIVNFGLGDFILASQIFGP
jgi:hypothetical protein